MRKFVISILVILSTVCSAQTPKTTLSEIQLLKQQRLDTIASVLEITQKDVVADIGSGKGYNIIRYANMFPPVKYFVEDIDSESCNKTVFAKQLKVFKSKIPIDSFHFTIGTETSTRLPSAFFTKVILTAVVHELDFRKEMMDDVKRILKPGGCIIIEEPLVHTKVKTAKGCHNPYLTYDEFKKILDNSGILITEEKGIKDIGINNYRKVFRCVVK